MKSKNYILNHDFGYGKENELTDEELNKLTLRNYEDVKFYIEWTIREIFIAQINKHNVIKFFDDADKTQVVIENLSKRYPWI